jgi:amidase
MDLTEFYGFQLSEKMQNLEITSEKILESYINKIKKINPKLNAIVSLKDTSLLFENCKKIDASRKKGKKLKPLSGLPIAIKDLEETKDIITTYGSLIYSHYKPKNDSPMVSNLRKSGLLIIGKTNTPEFGVGGQTFNEVFGTTANPFNFKKTAGGSSGGAAAAVQSKLIPFADGSDMMGSLRTPSSFCETFSIRPTPGLVPSNSTLSYKMPRISTNGVIARHPMDLALMLDGCIGKKAYFEKLIRNKFSLRKVTACIPENYLEKILLDNKVTKQFYQNIETFKKLGVKIKKINFDFEPNLFWESWIDLRSKIISLNLKKEFEENSHLLKDTIIWEIERGKKITDESIKVAKKKRLYLSKKINKILSIFNFLILPSAQVFPFDKNNAFPRTINKTKTTTYHQWLEITILPSLIGLPVISIPHNTGSCKKALSTQFISAKNEDDRLLQFALNLFNATQKKI